MVRFPTDVKLHHRCRAALVGLALAPLLSAQPVRGPVGDVPALVARARAAAMRGDQGEVLACGLDLRALAPGDLRGHYLIAAASASYGPRFSRVVASQAFARVAALLCSETVAQVRGLPGLPARIDVEALRRTVADWRRELNAGGRLLLAPDRAATTLLEARLRDRVAQIEAWTQRERDRLARARKQKTESEKALRREQTRKRRMGETFVDVQPIVDRIHASERAIQTCERRIGEFEAQRDDVRGELELASACLRAMH